MSMTSPDHSCKPSC
uniref:Uncharacterized protein n=1 Tax=Arundo donax TaxID=35708 RepID=A0A0A8Y4X7_ARUDO